MTKVEVTPHIPIMVNEILGFAEPCLSKPGTRYFDGTFGRGGHLKAILERYPNCTALAFDRDQEAITYAEQNFKSLLEESRLQVAHKNYADFNPQELGEFDYMLIDLGVSSPQLDEAARGFSFYHDGPLDMRMDHEQELTAADILNTYPEKELIQIFKEYGEVKSPFRVVRALLHDRQVTPYTSTRAFAGMIERVDRWKRKGSHPATQYFLGLRLAVNQELEATQEGVRRLVTGLKPHGRLAVLTFHSLEDRIVKRLFKDELKEFGRPVFKKVMEPSQDEIRQNPRSRSAKLRVFERSLQDADRSKKNKYSSS